MHHRCGASDFVHAIQMMYGPRSFSQRVRVRNSCLHKRFREQHRFRQPLLVTSAFHMRRSVRAFQREGIAVTPVPANFVTSSERAIVWADLLPESGALNGSATALREFLGLLYYRLGGQGAT